jgi:UDP-N-acetyl-D-mannosaminuronic acid transferase (WecB/TagA/CpsF family)
MSNLINKIFLWTKEEVSIQILNFYKQNSYCIVNFIYFANLHKFILDKKDEKYFQALENWSFLLPDGIALKIYLKSKYKKLLRENLNWTDFTPYFLWKIVYFLLSKFPEKDFQVKLKINLFYHFLKFFYILKN